MTQHHGRSFRLKGSFLTVLLAAAIFLLGQVAAALVVLAIEPGVLDGDGVLTPWQHFASFGALGLVVVGLLHIVLNKHHGGDIRGTLSQLGLRRLMPEHLGIIVILQFLYIATSAAFIIFLESQNYIQLDDNQSIGFDRALQGAALVPAFLTLVVLVPVIEELLFRGFLYQRLSKLIGVIAAAAATSIIFGLAHIYGDGWQVVVAIDTALLSVFMIIAYQQTKTLLVPIIMHSIKNGLAFYVLFLL